MRIQLYKVVNGEHVFIKEESIPGNFDKFVRFKYASPSGRSYKYYKVQEALLVQDIPPGFLPNRPRRIMLAITEGETMHVQTNLRVFRNANEHANSYIVTLLAKQ